MAKHARQESLLTKAGKPRQRKPRTFARGKRPGRPRRQGSKLAHRRRPELSGREPVHVTWRVLRGLPNLRGPKAMQAIRAAFRAGKVRDELGFRLVHFSVMKNHVHLICEARDRDGLSRGLQGLSVRFARGLNRALGRRGKVLGDRYHSRVLRTPREVRWGLGYVLCNARKHNAELLVPKSLPRRWLDSCSSALLFAGWKGGAPEVALGEDATVVEAETWLLTKGWRRHGRLPMDHLPRPRSP